METEHNYGWVWVLAREFLNMVLAMGCKLVFIKKTMICWRMYEAIKVAPRGASHSQCIAVLIVVIVVWFKGIDAFCHTAKNDAFRSGVWSTLHNDLTWLKF